MWLYTIMTTVPFTLMLMKSVTVIALWMRVIVTSPLLCSIATVLTTALAELTSLVELRLWLPTLPFLTPTQAIGLTALTNMGKRGRVVKGSSCCSSSITSPVYLRLLRLSCCMVEVRAVKEWTIRSAYRCSAGGLLTTEHLERERRKDLGDVWKVKSLDWAIKPWCTTGQKKAFRGRNVPLESLTRLISSCCNVELKFSPCACKCYHHITVTWSILLV